MRGTVASIGDTMMCKIRNASVFLEPTLYSGRGWHLSAPHVSRWKTRTQLVMKCHESPQEGTDLVREVQEGFLEVVTQAEMERRVE